MQIIETNTYPWIIDFRFLVRRKTRHNLEYKNMPIRFFLIQCKDKEINEQYDKTVVNL